VQVPVPELADRVGDLSLAAGWAASASGSAELGELLALAAATRSPEDMVVSRPRSSATSASPPAAPAW
jgi:hypothetical protein